MDTFNLREPQGTDDDTDNHKIPLRSWEVNRHLDIYARFETGVLDAQNRYQLFDMDLVLGVFTDAGVNHVAFAGASLKDNANYRSYRAWVNGTDAANPNRTWGEEVLNAIVDCFNARTPGQAGGAGLTTDAAFIYADPVRPQLVDAFVTYLLRHSTNPTPVHPPTPNGLIQLTATLTHT